jgi:hypothetical protein
VNTDKPYKHGFDHRPGGMDPASPGVRHLIGTGGEPGFQNGWENMAPTGDIPVPVPMHFLIVIGQLNWMDLDGVTILQYQPKVVEIAGDVDGGADGTTVFTIPPAYRFEHDRPYPAHDNGGVYVPSRLYADGRYVRGTP